MFAKVSFNQFYKDCMKIWFGTCDKEYDDSLSEDGKTQIIRKAYDNIVIPRRATIGSAGYDFVIPADLDMVPNLSVTIPTGIRWQADSLDQVLLCVPRSGLGFKYGLKLVNTVGVIDADYSLGSNEGHILAKLSADSLLKLAAGDRFMQGIILRFDKTADDSSYAPESIRDGGFGSTDEHRDSYRVN